MVKKVIILVAILSNHHFVGIGQSIEKIDSLYHLGFELRNGPIDSAYTLISKSGQWSKASDFRFGILRAKIFSIFYFARKGQLDTAQQIQSAVLEEVQVNRQMRNTSEEGLAYLYSGIVNWRSFDLDGARKNYEKALEIFSRLDDSYFVPTTLSRLGILEMNQSNYSDALTYFVQSYEMKLDAQSVPSDYAPELQNIASVYNYMGLKRKALKHIRHALQLEMDRGNNLNIARSYLILGDIYKSLNSDSAIFYYNKGFILASNHQFHKNSWPCDL